MNRIDHKQRATEALAAAMAAKESHDTLRDRHAAAVAALASAFAAVERETLNRCAELCEEKARAPVPRGADRASVVYAGAVLRNIATRIRSLGAPYG